MNSKELGDFGERIAQAYLKKKKYKILARNFKKKWGEIDIVAKWKKVIIFVEVKTTFTTQKFFPEDKVNWKKKNQLRKIAQIYLSENKIPLNSPWQIDIIAINIDSYSKKARVKHFKNAIEDNF